MNLNDLVGKTFQERELFELLQFDIEENFERYALIYVHMYFKRTGGSEIVITEITYFENSDEIYKKSREQIEKKEWLEIAQNENHFNLLLTRLDRTGYLASIRKDKPTISHDWKRGWLDETPDQGPMTPDELRQGFLELAGVFLGQQELEKLKSKKAV